MPADQIVAEAYAAFDAWVRDNDPEGEMTMLEQVDAYGKWCDAGNSVVFAGDHQK